MPTLRYFKLAVFILILVLLYLFSDQGFFKLRRLRATEKRLKQENIELANKNSEMQAEIARLKDPGYLEKFIRDKIGYVKTNELVIEMGRP